MCDFKNESSTDLDYDVPWMTAEEGDPGVSAGRPTGTARVSIC